jgi:hypothetical protein
MQYTIYFANKTNFDWDQHFSIGDSHKNGFKNRYLPLFWEKGGI